MVVSEKNSNFATETTIKPMKKEFKQCPQGIDESKLYGFSWMEHVLAIPSPLVVVTSYKANGKPNATMQSWCTFTGDGGAMRVIFADVNKYGHMYQSVKETGVMVVNFPSREIFNKCIATIANNGYDTDEITAAGLTVEPATVISAPRISECFLNLECELEWEHDLCAGSCHSVMCARVVNVCMDEQHYDAERLGRYGDMGYLYNIHSPHNPETGKAENTCIGTIGGLTKYEDLEK